MTKDEKDFYFFKDFFLNTEDIFVYKRPYVSKYGFGNHIAIVFGDKIYECLASTGGDSEFVIEEFNWIIKKRDGLFSNNLSLLRAVEKSSFDVVEKVFDENMRTSRKFADPEYIKGLLENVRVEYQKHFLSFMHKTNNKKKVSIWT